MYAEAFIFCPYRQTSIAADREKLVGKTLDLLGFIQDQILSKFPFSLPFLPDYGGFSNINRKEYCEFLDGALKDRVLGFELQTGEKQNPSKKKLFTYYEVKSINQKPTEYSDDFWPLLASGEAWAMSYDGLLLFLIDIFSFIQESDLLKVSTIKEILKEIKGTLQNLLYCVILTADKYQTCHLKPLLYVMITSYRACPAGDDQIITLPNNFKLTLKENLEIPEFSLDPKCYQDHNLKELFEELRKKDIMEEFAFKSLTPDVVSSFVGECFIRYFIENGLQIFDLQTFFDSPLYFDVCLKLRETFLPYGFVFRHAMTFVEEVVYRSDETVKSEVQLQKITKKVAELIQAGKPQGRKTALREEKKRRMDVRFQYVDEKEKPQKTVLAEFLFNDDEFGVNAESIFIEFEKAKVFAQDSSNIVMKPAYERLIDTFWNLAGDKHVSLKPSEMAAYFSVQFLKKGDKYESRTLKRLKFFNQVCKAFENRGEIEEIQNFLSLIKQAEMDENVYKNLGQWRSLHLEVESFNFLTNYLLYYESSFDELSTYFLSQGDELFHISKQIFCKKSLENLAKIIDQTTTNHLIIELGIKYLQFLALLYQKASVADLSASLLSRFDKLTFHMYRRLGEYLNALNTFFQRDLYHQYVLKLKSQIIRCLLHLLQFSANSLPFDSDHPFVKGFCDFFNEPLSLSTNAEDELITEAYETSVQLLNHMFEVLSRSQLIVLISRINLNSIMKTLVLIQDLVLKFSGQQLAKNILCDNCTPSCTFFSCKDKRATKHQKRLADTGFQLCVLITKGRLIFGEKLLAGLPWLHEPTDFGPHLLIVNKVIDSQIMKFDAFFKEVNSKMAAFSKAAGTRKESSKSGGNPKYSRVATKQADMDKNQSSILPMNDNQLEKSDDLSNKLDDEKPANLSKEEPEPPYHEAPERQATQDSLKFLVTVDRQSLNKSDDGSSTANTDFDIVEIFQKFGTENHDDDQQKFGQPEVENKEDELSLPVLAKETFKRQELDLIKTEIENYRSALASKKVDQAFTHYQKELEFIRLSNGAFPISDENLVVIQNRYYFTLPHIVNYCSEQMQNEIIQKLIKFPPRTRKEIFLREMNLYLGDLTEYQKLYAFKELSWIVWIANLTKYVNIAIIIFINLYCLVLLDTGNKNSLAEQSFLFSVLILGTCISGLSSIFIPVQKMFLAKTFVTKFNSYKNRINQDFLLEQSRSVIQEDRKTYIRIYEKYARLVSKINTLLQFSKSKYLVALAHYDNIFQFIIFYLSILGVVNKSVGPSYINFFLVVAETSMIYQVYGNLALNLWKILVYFLFLCMLFYQLGVVYLGSFLDQTKLPSGISCNNLLSCLETVVSFTLMGDHGYTENRKENYLNEKGRNPRLISDTISFEIVSFFTMMLVLGILPSSGFLVLQLAANRRTTNMIKSKIKTQCLICGSDKSNMEQR